MAAKKTTVDGVFERSSYKTECKLGRSIRLGGDIWIIDYEENV